MGLKRRGVEPIKLQLVLQIIMSTAAQEGQQAMGERSQSQMLNL